MERSVTSKNQRRHSRKKYQPSSILPNKREGYHCVATLISSAMSATAMPSSVPSDITVDQSKVPPTEASTAPMDTDNPSAENVSTEANIDKNSEKSKPKRKTSKKRSRNARRKAKAKEKMKELKEEHPTRQSSRRSKRQRSSGSSSNNNVEVNSSHFVGYVEEGETVEMIMRKFQQLENLKEELKLQKNGANEDSNGNNMSASGDKMDVDGPNDNHLDEEALQELFHRTSNFTVKSTSLAEEMAEEMFGYGLTDGWQMPSNVTDIVMADEDDYDELQNLFEIDDATWDDMFNEKKIKKTRVPGERKQRVPKEGSAAIAFISDRAGRFMTAIRRVRKRDPNAVQYTRVPSEPLPLSWASSIKPYIPHTVIEKRKNDAQNSKKNPFITTDNLTGMNLGVNEDITKHGDFQCVLLDPPYEREVNPFEPEMLNKLNLGSEKLMTSGFVMIWAPKNMILRTMRALEKEGFFYVENLTWVKKKLDNKNLTQPSPICRTSHETLLIFRKGTRHKNPEKRQIILWKKIEIRHQRTCTFSL